MKLTNTKEIFKSSLILLTSSSFFFILLLIIPDVFLRAYYKKFLKDDLYKEYVQKRPEIIDIYKQSGLNISDVKQLLEESYRYKDKVNGNWIYDEFLGFRETPRSTRFVNVSKHGFRRNSKNLPLDKDIFDPKLENQNKQAIKNNFKKKIIYFFGGSTGFGYGVTDSQTIPAHMEVFDSNLQVFNFGRGYYYSEQENLLLDRLINNGAKKPDIAIFLDGNTERNSIRVYQDQMSSLFGSLTKPGYFWNSGEFAKPIFFILSRFKTKFAPNMEVGLANNMKYLPQYNLKAMDVTESFQTHMKSRDFICRKHEIKCITFLEPHAGQDTVHKYETIENKKELLNFYSKLKEIDYEYVDFTGILSNHNKQAFIDGCHYTSEAQKIIAKGIVDYIKTSN